MITDEEAEQLMPGPASMFEHLRTLQTTKAEYLEKMAASFVLMTGVPATECELVQEQLKHPSIGWKFYFRIRGRK